MYVHRLWLWFWFCCEYGQVGIALILLYSTELWMLNNGPIYRIAFNALLFEYVSDQKWEW